jgi:outer membrane protein assembly factor BamB
MPAASVRVVVDRRREVVRSIALVVVAAGTVALSLARGGVSAPYDWTSYSGGDTMTNSARSTAITPATAQKLHPAWSRRLDGAVFSSPLYLRTGVRKPLVLVATMSNSLYALSAANGAVVWKHSLGAPQPTVCKGSYGIASTPYVDRATGRVYVIGARGLLWALDVRTGKPISGWPVRIVSRTTVEFAWSGLRLRDGLLYVNVASYCDVPDAQNRPADGYTDAVDVKKRKIVARFDVVPGPANMGGAWGYGGVSIDRDGSVYLATGNAAVFRGDKLIENAPHGESIVHLTRHLRVLAAAPAPDKAKDNIGDEDYGSSPLLFQPRGCPPLVAANSKNGYTYVWKRSDLAHPLWSASLGPTSANEPFLGEPSWDVATRLLVVTESTFGAPNDLHRGVSAFAPNGACTTFTHRWDTNVGGGAQPPALIVGGVVFSAVATRQMLYAFDVRTGSILWQRKINASQAPIATNGEAVFVADTNGVVTAYAPRS